MELACDGLLHELCFIDERDADDAAASEKLTRYGQRGIVGAFDAVFGSASDHRAEVQSIYAELFHALGYLDVGPLVPRSRWMEMRAGLVEAHALTDMRRSTLTGDYGEPSLVLDKRVLCYVSDAMPAEWLFFDCWEPHGESYQEGEGGLGPTPPSDPLLRDVRVPGPTFEAGLILSLWGKFQRWGPTWRFEHPEHAGGEGYPPGVREQLLEIRSQDPSQALGPRRP